MNTSAQPQLSLDNVDALISELETEYAQVATFGTNVMPVTNNCTFNNLTLGQCCKTF